jgi:hypothetical protein
MAHFPKEYRQRLLERVLKIRPTPREGTLPTGNGLKPSTFVRLVSSPGDF